MKVGMPKAIIELMLSPKADGPRSPVVNIS
jgi:hypothetical protein